MTPTATYNYVLDDMNAFMLHGLRPFEISYKLSSGKKRKLYIQYKLGYSGSEKFVEFSKKEIFLSKWFRNGTLDQQERVQHH